MIYWPKSQVIILYCTQRPKNYLSVHCLWHHILCNHGRHGFARGQSGCHALSFRNLSCHPILYTVHEFDTCFCGDWLALQASHTWPLVELQCLSVAVGYYHQSVLKTIRRNTNILSFWCKCLLNCGQHLKLFSGTWPPSRLSKPIPLPGCSLFTSP